MASYKHALEIEPLSFFPNYNLGMLLILDKDRFANSIQYLKVASE